MFCLLPSSVTSLLGGPDRSESVTDSAIKIERKKENIQNHLYGISKCKAHDGNTNTTLLGQTNVYCKLN